MISKQLLKISNNLKLILLSVLFSVLSLIINISIIYSLTKMLIDKSFNYIFIIVVLLILKLISNTLAKNYSLKASIFIKPLLRKKIFNKAYDLSINNTDKIESAYLSQLASEGVEQLEIYYSRYLPQLFYASIAPLVLSLIIGIINPKIGVVLLICAPAIPLLIFLIQKMTRKILDRHWGKYTSLGKRFYDFLLGINILKKYNIAKEKELVIEQESEEFRKSTMKVLMMQLNSIIIMDFMAFGGTAVGLYISYQQYRIGAITLFELVFIILLIADYFIPLRLLGSYFHIAMNGIAASGRILDFLNIDIENDKGIEEFNYGNINIENLTHNYDGKDILKNINLKFNKNKFYSIVGPSGCGKSTLARLIAKRVHSDAIYINDININEINNQSYLKKVAYVNEDGHLFNNTIYDNLNVYGNQSEEDVVRVLRILKLDHKFNLETIIEPNYTNISGGEKQRLILARALLLDADIYIFDEITSNVDSVTEKDILKIIKSLSKTKIVIFITHNLLNIIDSEKIVYIKNGSVINFENHEMLLKENSAYRKDFEYQQRILKNHQEKIYEK